MAHTIYGPSSNVSRLCPTADQHILGLSKELDDSSPCLPDATAELRLGTEFEVSSALDVRYPSVFIDTVGNFVE